MGVNINLVEGIRPSSIQKKIYISMPRRNSCIILQDISCINVESFFYSFLLQFISTLNRSFAYKQSSVHKKK